jgi:hypothetical protein
MRRILLPFGEEEELRSPSAPWFWPESVALDERWKDSPAACLPFCC